MFKYLGHTQFPEVCATSKEIVLFHDNGLVLLRFACRFNQQSIVGFYRDVMDDRKVECIHYMDGCFLKLLKYFRWLFFSRSFGDEF
jgi:hypothetical protein